MGAAPSSSLSTYDTNTCSPTTSLPTYTSTKTFTEASYGTFTSQQPYPIAYVTTTKTYDTTTSTQYTSYVTAPPRYVNVTDQPTTVFVFESAIATTVVPTKDSFTPIECYPIYFQSVETISTTVSTFVYTAIVTAPAESPLVTVTVEQPIYNETVTVPYTIYPTEYLFPTTVTVTRDYPTKTIYAACASNNVVSRYPDPNTNQYLLDVSGYPLGSPDVHPSTIAAFDPTDCCNLCQANEACIGSQFQVGQTLGNCKLFLKDAGAGNQTCDPSVPRAGAPFHYSQPSVVLSNGPCGRLDIFRGF